MSEDPISFSHNLKKIWNSLTDGERKSSIALSFIENKLYVLSIETKMVSGDFTNLLSPVNSKENASNYFDFIIQPIDARIHELLFIRSKIAFPTGFGCYKELAVNAISCLAEEKLEIFNLKSLDENFREKWLES